MRVLSCFLCSLLQAWTGQLPVNLLLGMLRLSWTLDKRQRTPAEEVRCALRLRSVCHRIGQRLRAQPLPLHLDFSRPAWQEKSQHIDFKQEHVHWLASAAQQDSVVALTLPGWNMSREFRSAITRMRVSRSLTVEALQALAGNQRQSLRQLHGIPADCIGRDLQQIDLSALAVTHLGLVLDAPGQAVCAAALPATLQSLACCEEFLSGYLAELQDVWSLPCLTCLHVRCSSISVPSSLGPSWCKKHVVLTATLGVTVNYNTSAEGAAGLFGAASTVRIEAGSMTFLSVHGGGAQLRALASMLCPDTLDGAVLVAHHGGVKFVAALDPTASAVAWVHVLRVMICECGNRFAFEVHRGEMDYSVGYRSIHIARSRWPTPGTHAHKAAAELHSQAVEYAKSASFQQSKYEGWVPSR